jgi:hypothetical protein
MNEERLKSIILKEAYRTIKVNEGEKKVSIPMAQAIVRALAVNAAKGQHRSLQLFTEMLTLTERENKASYDEYLKTMIEYKIDWEQEIDRCKRQGVPVPEPLPHPDDIIIDMKTGEAIIRGPWTKEDKVTWDSLAKRRDACDEEIREIKKLVVDPESAKYRHLLQEDLAFEEKLRALITNSIGEWPHNRGQPLEK